MARPERILIATTNRGKTREVLAVLGDLSIQFVTLADFPGLPIPDETGSTFAENAALKAMHYAAGSNLWSLADDSGLEVDALHGAPGVHSARYAGPNATDAENNRRLIAALAGVPEDRRTARFRCATALAAPDGVRARSAGAVEGLIVDQPRGSNGFGYDPHFFLSHLGLTMGELPPEQKNAISHRGEALRAMCCELERM